MHLTVSNLAHFLISRGLLDVLPDEASLAMVLSDELAHIALGHRTETNFAFSDQTMLGDSELLKRLQKSKTLSRDAWLERKTPVNPTQFVQIQSLEGSIQ